MTYSSISIESGHIERDGNLPVYYDIYAPVASPGTVFKVILFLHGFKGFKDWGAFPDACEELARAGYVLVAMNFSRNGYGGSREEVTEPDSFAEQTLSADLQDVEDVIDAIKRGQISHSKVVLDSDHFGIIGHSRGGHTAIVAAAEFPEIRCCVTWAAVASYLDRWDPEMVEEWREKGSTEVKNSRTGETYPLLWSVYEDAEQHADRLMAIRRVKELYIPVLFVAGKADESVPVADSERLYTECPSSDKEIRFIEGAGHTFNTSHPFVEDDFPRAFEELLNHTENWFLEYLK